MADESTDKGLDLDELKKVVADLKGAGGSDKLADKLADVLADNAKLRAKLRGEKAAAVPDGALVLPADDAKLWKKYRDLGADPGELRSQLEAGRQATAELSDIRTAETHRRAAEIGGFRPGLFARLARADGLRLSVEKKAGDDGKPVESVFVMGEGDARTPLKDYAEAHWGDDLPALKADPDKDQPPPSRPGLPPREQRRVAPEPGVSAGAEDKMIRAALVRAGAGSL